MTENQIVLTVPELKEIGLTLSALATNLEMTNISLNSLSVADKADQAFSKWLTERFIDLSYTQNENIITSLGEMARKLLTCDDRKELEA